MRTIEQITDFYGKKLASAAFELGAIKLSPAKPFTWASGYRMPIYNDNRMFLANYEFRALIRDAFSEMIDALSIDVDNIAGTSTAGIPHATSLADKLKKPLSYVRSYAKDHGMGNQIEGLGSGGSYEGKKVLLIEDLISTGSSSVKALQAVRDAQGDCTDCFAIFTYGLNKSDEAFKALNPICNVYTILSYPMMINTALAVGYISDSEADSLQEWRNSPFDWGLKHGFPKVGE